MIVSGEEGKEVGGGGNFFQCHLDQPELHMNSLRSEPGPP
jgi:hypothetical protein